VIYTFYSYKGGVGRSMAMANVGEFLYSRGARIVLVDWDLEAPGLENFFFDKPERIADVRSQLGLIDLLEDYKRRFTKARAALPADDAGIFERIVSQLLPIETYLFPIHERAPGRGGLWLLPAGWRATASQAESSSESAAGRSDDRFSKYAELVQSFDWADFYSRFEGEAFFEWFRRQLLSPFGGGTIEAGPIDAVLIDSRTGVTEVGGIATRQLADVVVCFTAPNYQNLAGVADMSRSFLHKDVLEARKQPTQEVVVIPARVDEAGVTTEQNKFRSLFEMTTKAPPTFGRLNINPWDLLIPYVTKYAYAETLTINSADSNPRLERAYRNLASHLILFAPAESRLRAIFASDVQSLSQAAVPRVYVLAAGSADGAAVRERLAREMEVVSAMEAAGSMVVLLDGLDASATALPAPARSAIRIARQKGVCVYFAAAGPAAFPGLPNSLKQARLFDLDKEWQPLLKQLRQPCRTLRVPFMAPTAPSLIAGRNAEVDAVVGGLLSQGPRGSALVALYGARGMGLSTIAVQVCHDERILDAFEDGILWVTLNDEPDLLAVVRHLHGAVSAEPATINSVEAGLARVSEKLAGRACLLVLNSVWKPRDADIFSALPCCRLVTAHRIDVAREAIRINVGPLSIPAAVQVLSAGMPGPEVILQQLALQLGAWPAALIRARAQLNGGVSAEALRRSLDERGPHALGDAAAELQSWYSARADSLLSQLSELDRELYRRLADVAPGSNVSIDDLVALWRIEPDTARSVVERLAALDLLIRWPNPDSIRLNTFAAAYLRELREKEREAQKRSSADVSVARACVLRPFGVKGSVSGSIDFDRVDRDLLQPALLSAGIAVTTLDSAIVAGNVRGDALQRLLLSDIVVADISVANADVFYLLGVRHALVDKHTFLLQAKVDFLPFDLRTDRYLQYDPEAPGSSVQPLVGALRQVLASDRGDSPVLQVFPELAPADRRRFSAVPADLLAEIERAQSSRGDLSLLASEVTGFPWEQAALHKIENYQRSLRDSKASRVTLERLLQLDSADVDATARLAMVYRESGDFERSDRLFERLLARKDITNRGRVDALVGVAANAKRRWRSEWNGAGHSLKDRQEAALSSPQLVRAIDKFEEAFALDLNSYYAGLNALSLLTILVGLAGACPETWLIMFETEQEAQFRLSDAQGRLERLRAGVDLAIRAAEGFGSDAWLAVSRGDWRFLAAKSSRMVVHDYKKAASFSPFVVDAIRTQLEIFRSLDVLASLANEVLEALPPTTTEPPELSRHVLLFVGHMIDLPGRPAPRFPADMELVAHHAIEDAVRRESSRTGGPVTGIAGASNGGDILFHEVCLQLGIRTEMYLTVPAERYVAAAVAAAGPSWVDRFYRLYHQLPSRVLADSFELPSWLRERQGYGVWQRNSLWMLHNALAAGDTMTLIALWNGAPADGPGGVQDMVETARKREANVVILDTKLLFSLST